MHETAPLPADSLLPKYARAVLAAARGGPEADRPHAAELHRTAGAFVTLRRPDGALQGCIGTIEPRGPLLVTVGDCARGAAFRDPRGVRLALADVADLFVEVSVLSPTERVPFTDEASARAALRPGRDGVVLRWRDHQGTFLPQMWPRLGDAAHFLDELKRKAGLPMDFWSPEIELSRYTVEAYTDGVEPEGPED
jgi:AmmeMemoRadiSam system protein A